MLVNLSNHPYAEWGTPQRAATAPFGVTLDLPFPHVAPDADAVTVLADGLAAQVVARLAGGGPHAALVSGEMTLTAAVVARLQRAGVRCVAATTARDVETLPDGARRVAFRFVRFRDYPPLCP